MKKASFVLFACLVFAPAALAQTCEEKIKAISTEMDEAKLHNNEKRHQGLEVALRNVRQNCTDSGLAQDKSKKIKGKQADVDEAKQKLDAAIAEGLPQKKIDKKRRKLEEQKQELFEEAK